MRALLLIFFGCLAVSPLRADALNARLRLLLPGDEPAVVNERQFLYQRVSGLLQTLDREDKVSRRSTKKKISRIEARLRREYLREYRAGAELADAFRSGDYSDATAAVLTALVFEHFGVDYYGFVDYWEAYLLADPDGRATAIRPPSSRKRKDTAMANFRRDYVSLVRATVAEDLSTMNEIEARAFFHKYHYDPDRRLTFGQLSAYLQYRRAQAAYARQRYAATTELLEAALRREERPAFLVLRRAAELQMAARDRPAVAGDIGEFFRLWTEDPTNRYFPAAILNHFDEQQRLLLAQDRPDLARKLLGDYLTQAPGNDPAWDAELRHLHRLRLLKHFHANGRLDLAKRLADSLYQERPTDEAIKYVLGQLVIDNLRRSQSGSQDFTRQVEAAATRYPFIRGQDRFADLLLREQAWKVRDLYEQDRPDLAVPALERFRKSLVDIPIGGERNLWTLTAFVAASNYHFRVEDYREARRYLEEALRYAPQDQFLLHRRAVLAKY
ncbi:MAG: hypothetical protein AAFZ52_10860 [Bacteroidota bacterium]